VSGDGNVAATRADRHSTWRWHQARSKGFGSFPYRTGLAELDDGITGDGEADLVVALDVLERTNAIHHAFDELCRLARRHVLIALPNQFDIHDRLVTVRGRKRSGKYGYR
jgi:hypothetical protein